MEYLFYGFLLLIPLLVGLLFLHVLNINKIFNHVENLKKPEHISKDDFYREITVSQGSNFIGIAMVAWILLFVAISYLYFFIPTVFAYNYINILPNWASNEFGFFIFGMIAASFAITLILISDNLPKSHRYLKLTEIYSFYFISKNMKKIISLSIPLLSLSILISAYSGTIFPERNPLAEAASFTLLALSTIILLLPVLEVRK